MFKRGMQIVGCIAVMLALAGAVAAQDQPAPTYEQVILRQWNAIHKKVIDMAKDIPDDKLDARPHKDSRSLIQEVWHVTATAQWFEAQMTGKQVDTNKLFSNEGKPRDRAQFVAQLEQAVSSCAALLEKQPTPRAIGIIEHAGEHYGKMVSIYRINGMVPPVSRPKE